MIRIMLDSDNPAALTGDVPLLATYADLVPDPAELGRKFPDSQVLLIDRGMGDPAGESTIIDVERGAYTPEHVPAWLRTKEQEGKRDLAVYVDRNNLAAVDALAHGLSYVRWVATLDGTAHIDGFEPLKAPAAVQIIGAAAVGIHADLSLVFDDAWHRAPEPKWLRNAANLAASSLNHASVLAGDIHALSNVLSAHH